MRCQGPELIREFDTGATPQYRGLAVSEADGVIRPGNVVDKLSFASEDAIVYIMNNRSDPDTTDDVRQTQISHVDLPLKQQTKWKDYTTNFFVNRPRENITTELVHTAKDEHVQQTWAIEYYASSGPSEFDRLHDKR